MLHDMLPDSIMEQLFNRDCVEILAILKDPNLPAEERTAKLKMITKRAEGYQELSLELAKQMRAKVQ